MAVGILQASSVKVGTAVAIALHLSLEVGLMTYWLMIVSVVTCTRFCSWEVKLQSPVQALGDTFTSLVITMTVAMTRNISAPDAPTPTKSDKTRGQHVGLAQDHHNTVLALYQ